MTPAQRKAAATRRKKRILEMNLRDLENDRILNNLRRVIDAEIAEASKPSPSPWARFVKWLRG